MEPTRHPRRALCWLIALALLLMPVGQPLPAVPGGDCLEGPLAVASLLVLLSPGGALTEDDFEVDHHDFTFTPHPRTHTHSTARALSSILWTERLHRPPIA